jgi:hypothetical protein
LNVVRASVVLALLACGEPGGPGGPPGGGHVVWSYQGQIFRAPVEDGVEPENLSAALGAGTDRRVTQSLGGDWLTWSGERFDCSGECLVRARVDLSEGEAVKPGGVDVYTEGVSAITDDGQTVVFSSQGGPHQVDLFVTTRSAGGWTEAVLLTGDSPYAYNNMPAITPDGSAVSFDCGAEPYPESGGNDACRVAIGGSGFSRVVGPDALPDSRNDYVQNPHEGPAGLFFEGSWPIGDATPETIWTLPSGASTPEPFGAFDNAVSPCSLPDGRVALLWLGGNEGGRHELVVADADGNNVVEITPGVDVDDIGFGCGE